MAKIARAVALTICIAIACSLFKKCTAETTDSSSVDVTLLPSTDIEMSQNISLTEYTFEPTSIPSSITVNSKEENRMDNSTTEENSAPIIPTNSSLVHEGQTSIFPSEATPSVTFFSDNEPTSGYLQHGQTPELGLTLLSSFPTNSDFQTSLRSEFSENNFTSLNPMQASALFTEPLIESYDNSSHQDINESVVSSSSDMNQDAMSNNLESTVTNEDFKVSRMGKEVTVVLHATSDLGASDTITSNSEIQHSTYLTDIEDTLFESESKNTIKDDVVPVSQTLSYDSNASFTDTEVSISIGLGKKGSENTSANLPNTKHVVLILKRDCAGVNIFQNMFAVLNTHLMGLMSSVSGQNANINTVNCDAFFHLTLSIDSATDQVIKEVANILLSNITLGEDLKVEKVFLNSADYIKFTSIPARTSNFDTNEDGLFLKQEIIAYIVAGVCLGLFICTLMACCCARLFCKKQTNSLDLCDIPHLNLKLEDYKLTPIPRPTISFPEYGRELFNPTYNDSAPRMEDTILNQHHFSGDSTNSMAKDSASHSREMRTFGGKKSCSRVQSLDIKPNMRGGNGWISNSTEKLNMDFEKKTGFDNGGFRKWF